MSLTTTLQTPVDISHVWDNMRVQLNLQNVIPCRSGDLKFCLPYLNKLIPFTCKYTENQRIDLILNAKESNPLILFIYNRSSLAWRLSDEDYLSCKEGNVVLLITSIAASEYYTGSFLLLLAEYICKSLRISILTLDDDSHITFGEGKVNLYLLRTFRGCMSSWYEKYGYKRIKSYYSDQKMIEDLQSLIECPTNLLLEFLTPSDAIRSKISQIFYEYDPIAQNIGQYMFYLSFTDSLSYRIIENHLWKNKRWLTHIKKLRDSLTFEKYLFMSE